MSGPAYEWFIDRLRERGGPVNDNGHGKAMAQCPAHPDDKPSLSLRAIEGSVLLHCFGGCNTDSVLAALGGTKASLFDNPRGATYGYPGGRRVHRTPEKKFSQSGDTKTDRTLFHQDRIGDAEIVYVVEGEKDVLSIESVGGTAVTSAGGAANAHQADWNPLHRKVVFVVVDKDNAGLKYAQAVRRQLIDVEPSVVLFVQAAEGKDASDHVAAGKGLEEFVPLEPDVVPDPEPEPLTRNVRLLPFPVDALPTIYADMVNAVAEATQTDPAMAGVSALSALSSCTGGHAEIEIRRGWHEPLNIYTTTVAGPGERKSSVQLSMLGPILEVEEQLAAEGSGATLEAETRKHVALKIAEKERNTAAVEKKGQEQSAALADAIGAAQAADAIEVPPIPRLIADDVTPEAAASLLVEQGGRLAIISAEGGIFDIIAGRYSKSVPNMDLWLKGHSGDPLKVDRKGRPPEYVRRPALTLGLMIQPSVLSAIAEHREFRGRGLLARILYALPVSKVGHRTIAPDPVDPLIEKAYSTTLSDLVRGMVAHTDPVILTLTDTAHTAMTMIETAVEPTLAPDGELGALADWGAKYLGAVARIAGMLHLAEHGAHDGPLKQVTAQTIRSASRIGDYFKAAAINAFAEMGADQDTADAVYLLERIRHVTAGTEGQVSERDMQRASKSRFRDRAAMVPAMNRLIEHGYLIPLAAEATGGRPTTRFRIHEVRTKGPKGTEGSQ